jgi:hypothetical protein
MKLRLTLALSLLALPALADVPPGPAPGPPPPQPAPGPGQCNAAPSRPGEQCVECSAWYEQPDKCQRELGSQGYAQRCRMPGASVWKEIWCRGPAGGPPPEKKGCRSCAVGSDASGWASGLAACAALGLACWRRRR